MESEIPSNIPYGVFTGLLHRFHRICSERSDFADEAVGLASVLNGQGAKLRRLIQCFYSFVYGRGKRLHQSEASFANRLRGWVESGASLGVGITGPVMGEVSSLDSVRVPRGASERGYREEAVDFLNKLRDGIADDLAPDRRETVNLVDEIGDGLSGGTLLQTKGGTFRVTETPGDGNCLFWCLVEGERDRQKTRKMHQKTRKMLSSFLKDHSKDGWLLGAYQRLDLYDVPLTQHADDVARDGRWASYFDAFVCGLILGLDITVVTVGNEPVNLRSVVRSSTLLRWPARYDKGLRPRFIGHVNFSDVHSTSRLNHFVRLTEVDEQR